MLFLNELSHKSNTSDITPAIIEISGNGSRLFRQLLLVEALEPLCMLSRMRWEMRWLNRS
jgi:hypothetical protein